MVCHALVFAKDRGEEGKDRFKRWLEEDVPYLITDEEKAIFKKLTTDEEKEQFIEQFWARRDPNPLTSDNEFKIEHYRRIAYANDNFQSGKAGWKTDRGRVYILFGKPDEISHNPSGQIYNRDLNEGGGHTTTFPYEVWFYRKLPGVGDGVEIEFVDSTLTGEYRMAISPEEKDALLYASGTGSTLLEQMGYETREDRIRNMGIKDVSGASMFRYGELNHVFDRYQRFTSCGGPRKSSTRTFRRWSRRASATPCCRWSSPGATSSSAPGMFMVPVTLAIPNEALTFVEKEGHDAPRQGGALRDGAVAVGQDRLRVRGQPGQGTPVRHGHQRQGPRQIVLPAERPPDPGPLQDEPGGQGHRLRQHARCWTGP